MRGSDVSSEKSALNGLPRPWPIQRVQRTTWMIRTLVHALLAIPERGFRILRVIYNEAVDPVTVVTVYFDDGVTDL